jgi:hypothetical protein
VLQNIYEKLQVHSKIEAAVKVVPHFLFLAFPQELALRSNTRYNPFAVTSSNDNQEPETTARLDLADPSVTAQAH